LAQHVEAEIKIGVPDPTYSHSALSKTVFWTGLDCYVKWQSGMLIILRNVVHSCGQPHLQTIDHHICSCAGTALLAY